MASVCYRDETIHPIINERSKLAKKEYKTSCDLVKIVIHWELCNSFNFHHMNQRYMHNPESMMHNEMHNILWSFKIETDHLISARCTDLTKENLLILPSLQTT